MHKITIQILMMLFAFSAFISASAQEQIQNSDFEEWTDLTEQSERPTGWNNLTNAGGAMAILTSSVQSNYRSEDTRPGSEGQYSAKIVSMDMFGIAVANGVITTGQMQVPTITPTDGFNQTKIGEEEFHQAFTGKPDSLAVWVKYTVTDGSDQARISAIIHGDYEYTDPEQNDADANYVVAKAVQDFETNGEWMRLSIPFEYENADVDPAYILLTISSSNVPGEGAIDATLYVDDLEMIYNQDEAENFFFTHFKTEGASQNVDFSMEDREENGFGDYSDEYEVIINPNNDNPDDIQFTADFNEPAHIKMWVSGIPDIGDIEIVDSGDIVESPFTGTSELLSMLGMAPDMSFEMLIAGSTTGAPNLDAENDPSTEIIKIKITIDKNYLGVDPQEVNHFSFYPNPVQNELILNSNQQIDEVALYNLLGQQVKNISFNQSKGKIDVSRLQSGIYIMKVSQNGKQKSYRLIKS